MQTRDKDLRRIVRSRLLRDHADGGGTVICDEFAICRGQSRIDIAVINGSFAGYELKSGVDRLDRLRRQVTHYSHVFDTVTIVVAPEHLDRVEGYLPDWYGVWLTEGAELVDVKRGARNPEPCLRSRVQLLWREEMLRLLGERQLADGLLTKPRRELIAALCHCLAPADLTQLVREQVRMRHAAKSRTA